MRISELFQTKHINLDVLTPRELDVLSCLLENSASKKIAPILRITIETVDTHIANIGRKLEQNGRAQVVDCVKKSIYTEILHNRYINLVEGPGFEKTLRELKESRGTPIITLMPDCEIISFRKHKTKEIPSCFTNFIIFAGCSVLGLVL